MKQAVRSNRQRGKNNRKNNSGNSNGNGGSQNLNRVYDSTGPEGKVRGTPQQIVDKYQALARDSQTAGDRVLSENYLQHAEHYIRLINTITANIQARQNNKPDNNNNNASESDTPDNTESGDASSDTNNDANDDALEQPTSRKRNQKHQSQDSSSDDDDDEDSGMQTFDVKRRGRQSDNFGQDSLGFEGGSGSNNQSAPEKQASKDDGQNAEAPVKKPRARRKPNKPKSDVSGTQGEEAQTAESKAETVE